MNDDWLREEDCVHGSVACQAEIAWPRDCLVGIASRDFLERSKEVQWMLQASDHDANGRAVQTWNRSELDVWLNERRSRDWETQPMDSK